MPLSRTLPLAAPLVLVLLASPAGAAPTTALSLTPARPAGAATTCLTLTVAALDAAGAMASYTPTVTVSLASTASTRSATHPRLTAAPRPA